MSRQKPAIFVQQHTYRRRRIADAARLLPILGVILFMVPLLWINGESETRTTTTMIYVFGVWAGLAIVAAILARRLGPLKDGTEGDSDAGDER